jgi:hypothetical protein
LVLLEASWKAEVARIKKDPVGSNTGSIHPQKKKKKVNPLETSKSSAGV